MTNIVSSTRYDCVVVRSSFRKLRRFLQSDESLCCTSLINEFNEIGLAVVLTTVDVFTLKPLTYYSVYQQYRPAGCSSQEGHHCDLENVEFIEKVKGKIPLFLSRVQNM